MKFSALIVTAVHTPQLLISGQTGIERQQLLGQTTWTLGRHPSNLLAFRENSISRYHAKIEILQERHCFLVDLNSRNGSAVNRKPVTTPVFLKHGDRIHLGQTELMFEQNLFIPPDNTVAGEQVVMVHQSVRQGKIWQETLLSQNLSVRWESALSNLKAEVERSAAVKRLPKVLIIDVQAYRSDIKDFIHWCQNHYSDLAVLLIDSRERQIPLSLRQEMMELGCLDILPAFREPNLLDNVTGVVVHLNLVLRAFKEQTLRQDKLFLSLRKLEDLFHLAAELPMATPASPPATSNAQTNGAVTAATRKDVELEDLTMISRRARRNSA